MTGKILSLSAALILAGASLAADGNADARVAKQLDRLGIEYTTTDSNNFSIDRDLDGGRKQTVYIMSKTETYGGLEIREVWSNAGNFAAVPTADQMKQLLDDNATEKIGAWSIEAADDDSYLAYFSIKIPSYLRDKDLADVIDFAASVADEMKKKLFDTDTGDSPPPAD
jgi:hypothetical protein